ncbi:EAL domain-containing protein [Psychrobacillus sp. Sa2BUA9]|uniref:EAL domain-containing protein n=1 Tax=Psychrobacillus faecigallinarum TaxID=2762235 RepID=A0ABR8R5E7_9BACI|nr:GGDEF and EAL domain-containing protein [Psychrobacillus faecigallinarum]MBD7942897.1 EAL domain-containing protein [Psychrobacillus faecigallinarum]
MKERNIKGLSQTELTLIEYSYGLDSSIDGIGITDEDGKFVFANEAHATMYGFTKEHLLNNTWHICYDEEALQGILNSSVIPILNERGLWRGETVGTRVDGTKFPQELTLSKVEETNKIVCVVRDLTDIKIKEQHIDFLANHNELTNLPNRRSLERKLANIKHSSTVSVLFMDIDKLKLINDKFGHRVGDALLEGIAETLKSIQNESISVFHLSGDEFIVLITNKSQDVSLMIAEQIIEQIKVPYFIEGNEIYVTTSIGVSYFPSDSTELTELVNLADMAMYSAKQAGKNNFKIFNKRLKEKQDQKIKVETELRKAIENNEFLLHYQPKIDLATLELNGLEALIRWKNPVLGNVLPMDFIPIAEETGLIDEIGKWVIKEALNQISRWEAKGYSLVKVSVNVSPHQFRYTKLTEYIEMCMMATKVEPKYFEVEVTESVFEDFEIVLPILSQLKKMGIGISIDDFGTGYSSLSLLTKLPVDTLKIDQSFIRGGMHDSKDLALVKSIIDIGINLNLNVVAEGIETDKHVNLLREFGCPSGQGYLFNPPLTADEIEETYLIPLVQ